MPALGVEAFELASIGDGFECVTTAFGTFVKGDFAQRFCCFHEVCVFSVMRSLTACRDSLSRRA